MTSKHLFASLVLALLVSAAHGQEVVLKVSHFLPANSNAQQGAIQPWCDRIANDSGGRLKCQIFPAMQLGGTPPQLVDQLKNGVADVVWTLPSFSSGRFPVLEAMELPFMLPAGSVPSSQAVWEYYLQHGQKELDIYKVLALHVDPAAAFHTSKVPVTNLASLKGLKIRTASRMPLRLVAALGGTPVSMPPPQIPESIAKGVIDGALAAWELVPAAKLDELTKYCVFQRS